MIIQQHCAEILRQSHCSSVIQSDVQQSASAKLLDTFINSSVKVLHAEHMQLFIRKLQLPPLPDLLSPRPADFSYSMPMANPQIVV